MTESAPRSLPAGPAPIEGHGSTLGRILLLVSAALGFAIFYWAGHQFDIPTYAGFAGSLIRDESAAQAMIVSAVLVVLCVGIGSIIASRVHADAGMLCAAAGLMALSCRSGPVEYVLMSASGPGVFIALAIETALLLGFLIIGWLVLGQIVERNWIGVAVLPVDGEDEGLNQRLMACGGQVVAMILAMFLLSKNDDKFQAIAGVGLSAWIGAVGAYLLFPSRPSIWYWIGPSIVGVIGYLFAYFGAGDLWRIGIAPSSLARPLPLDYAGAGTIGSLLGYWMGRKWQLAREANEELESKAT